MAVRYYGEGEHKAGFLGFRASSGTGEQRYFSTRAAAVQDDSDSRFLFQRLSAEKQDAEWRLESLRLRYQRFVTTEHSGTKPCRGVGVQGITAAFFRDGPDNWTPGFVVSRFRDGETKPAKHFRMKRKLYSQVWQEVVEFWATEHGILDRDRIRLLESAPGPEQFKLLRRQMNEHEGYDIPVSALSPAFAEQRSEIEQQRALRNAQKMGLNKPSGLPAPPSEDLQAEVAAWFEQYQRA